MKDASKGVEVVPTPEPEGPVTGSGPEVHAKDVLGKLFSEGKIKLPESGKIVNVKKVTLRTMKPILDLLGVVLGELKLTAENLPSFNLQDPSVILKLISTHYDQVIDIAISLTDLSKDELLDMSSDESVLVIQSVITRNKAFFTTKVLPNLQLMGMVEEG
jgi:hypothetical protein